MLAQQRNNFTEYVEYMPGRCDMSYRGRVADANIHLSQSLLADVLC